MAEGGRLFLPVMLEAIANNQPEKAKWGVLLYNVTRGIRNMVVRIFLWASSMRYGV